MEKITVFWVKESDYYDNPRHKTKRDWVVRIERELEDLNLEEYLK